MKTDLAVDGTRFLVNGKPTYEGVDFEGAPVEGLLLNSRMIQGVFDDANPETAVKWRYPDTGTWDPDRNTDDFCAALPEYRRHGLLAVTVGLQGGGGIYTPDVYDNYVCSAYENDGSSREPFFERLARVLKAADECGMVVIVNCFYVKHARRLVDDATVADIVESVADRLLRTGYRNIIVDVANESGNWWKMPVFEPENIHKLIEITQGVTLDGRRLLAGSSTGGGDQIPGGKWLEVEDVSMPHGNGCTPERLRAKLRRLKADPIYKTRPRPIVVNEDSIFVENLDAAVSEYCSWGFYCQGHGSVYKDRTDWTVRAREPAYEELSGFQTPPVNWSINTPIKKAFFDRVREITQGK